MGLCGSCKDTFHDCETDFGRHLELELLSDSVCDGAMIRARASSISSRKSAHLKRKRMQGAFPTKYAHRPPRTCLHGRLIHLEDLQTFVVQAKATHVVAGSQDHHLRIGFCRVLTRRERIMNPQNDGRFM